jgi:hypothetical protein
MLVLEPRRAAESGRSVGKADQALGAEFVQKPSTRRTLAVQIDRELHRTAVAAERRQFVRGKQAINEGQQFDNRREPGRGGEDDLVTR